MNGTRVRRRGSLDDEGLKSFIGSVSGRRRAKAVVNTDECLERFIVTLDGNGVTFPS